MSHLYAVTSHKPTAVNFSVVCNFTSPTEQNLIIARTNHLKIFTIQPEHGLVLTAEVPIFGRIKSLEVFRPLSYEKDVLFVMIEQKKIAVIEFDPVTRQILTRSHLDAADRIGRDTEVGQRALIDPEAHLVGLLLYSGFIKIIPIEGVSFKEPFNVTIEESRLIDLRFLHGCYRPTLVILYEDNHRARHLKTVVLDMREKELAAGPWAQSNVDYTASLLIPVPSPVNGVVVVGLTSLTYVSGTGTIQAVEVQPAQITAYCQLDSTRFLLCDHRGQLSVLCLVYENGKVVSISSDLVGASSIAECMSYLSHGLVFVGSCLGDSQLIKLHAGHHEGGHVEVLDVYKNTGPIVDMVLVENDPGGQRQLVTCSGAYKDGSMRIIRNGIGIHEQASLEVPGIKAVWSLRESESAEHDKYLVQSFITETRVLSIEAEELAEIEISGFDAKSPSLFCGNMLGGTLVQVTASGARLVDCSSFALLHEYRTNKNITVAKGNHSQLVVALSGGGLVYLEVQGRQLVVVRETQLDQDVAAPSLRPRAPNAMDVDNEALLAVGMWTDNTVRLLALPSFEEVQRTCLDTETQARDILLASFDQTYLFVGMGDGHLITYTIDSLGSFCNKRIAVIGTQPIAFRHFFSNGELCVFASCDRPTVVYMRNGKVLFSGVDARSAVTSMTPFHAELFPDCITFATDRELVIGIVEDIQKIHVQTLPLGESPRRIAHCLTQRAYCLITEQIVQGEHGEESLSKVVFYDDTTMMPIGNYKLEMLEQGMSAIATSFVGYEGSFFIVGTGQIINEEAEPSKGRLLVFQIANGNVQLIAEKETKSAVYTLVSIMGLLAAGIGSKVQLYRYISKDANAFVQPELQAECSHQGHIMVMFLKASGDLLVVGDLVRSITILQYKPVENLLEESARDFNVHMMRSVEIIEAEYYLGCEDYGNLFTVRKQHAVDEESKLESVGCYHLGDYVNVMRRGTLVTQIDQDPCCLGSVLFGTVSGAIGSILSLTKEAYQFFSIVESAMRTAIVPVGGFSHTDYRNFHSDVKTLTARFILDGDLIEMLLDLSGAALEEVVKDINMQLTSNVAEAGGPGSSESHAALIASLADGRKVLTVEEVVQRVEDMSRLH